jgi:hypothetical protein
LLCILLDQNIAPSAEFDWSRFSPESLRKPNDSYKQGEENVEDAVAEEASLAIRVEPSFS